MEQQQLIKYNLFKPIKQMTLNLTLESVSGSPIPDYIYVNGGQFGSLRLETNKLPQKIKCSKKAHLEFFLCGKQSKSYPVQGDIIAKREFWAESTIEQNRQVWGDEKKHPYQMQYYNDKHQRIGHLTFSITYNRGLLYQGEVQESEKIILKKLLPFYQVRCPTYNFFSVLDSGNSKSIFTFVEDIYRDA